MGNFVLFSLLATMSVPIAQADFSKGTYTQLDRYGAPPPATELEKKYMTYLNGTKKGGTLKLAVTENMDLIWPSFFQKGLQKQVMRFFEGYLYETMMAPNPLRPEREVQAHIAKNIEADPQNKTYLINLRDDVRFFDGSPVTSEDVLYSYNIKMEEISGPPHKAYYEGMWGTPEVKPLDKLSLRVSFPDIPVNRQRQAIIEFLADVKIVKPNKVTNTEIKIPYPYLGTGPYQVVKCSRDSCRLVRRQDYWLPGAKIFNFDEISITVYRDTVIQREALKKSEINFLVESNYQAEREIDSGLKLGHYKKNEILKAPDQISMNVISMNMDRENIKDVRFRSALVLAMNLDQPEQMLYGGKISSLGIPGALSPYSPKGLPSDDTKKLISDEGDSATAIVKPYEQFGYASFVQISDRRARLSKATEILKEAGYKVDSQTLKLEKNGRPVELTLLTGFEDPFRGLYFFFKEDLQRLGIELNLRVVPDTAAFIAELRKNTYDLVKSPLEIPREFDVVDVDILTQRLHSKYASSQFINNSANLKCPDVDRALDLLTSLEADSPQYPVAIDALLRVLSAKVPFIMIGERTTATVYADPKICLPPSTNAMMASASYCTGNNSLF